MATCSSILVQRILWTEEPGGLLSIGSHRVGHDWSDLAWMHALEKEMATHSSILAWRIPGTEEPDGLSSMGSHRVGHDWSDLAAAAARRRRLVGCSPWGHEELDTTEWLHFHFSLSCIGEGNGNPLQCSCLENPRGGGAWWAPVYGVAQSRPQLKRLSSSSSKELFYSINFWGPRLFALVSLYT